jgi:hypothetical protein
MAASAVAEQATRTPASSRHRVVGVIFVIPCLVVIPGTRARDLSDVRGGVFAPACDIEGGMPPHFCFVLVTGLYVLCVWFDDILRVSFHLPASSLAESTQFARNRMQPLPGGRCCGAPGKTMEKVGSELQRKSM